MNPVVASTKGVLHDEQDIAETLCKIIRDKQGNSGLQLLSKELDSGD